jgi:hypothetical protein
MEHNNFESWKNGEDKDKIKKIIGENKSSIGFDDKTNLEQEIADKRFANKETFEMEDLQKIKQIINDLVNKDQKLIKDIQTLKGDTNTEIDNFTTEVNNFDNSTGEKLSEKDTEKFLDFVNKSLSESFKRRVLLESRLDISVSLINIFNKVINTFENARKSPEDGDDLEMFHLAINAFREQSKQAESIYLGVKSELLEIDKISKIANSFLEKKKVSDYLRDHM